MLKDEIIEMAKKCGLVGMRSHADGIYIDALLDFAKLAAEAEREACAKLCEYYFLDGMASRIRTREKDD
jgi:hypothetical protein